MHKTLHVTAGYSATVALAKVATRLKTSRLLVCFVAQQRMYKCLSRF